MLIGLPPMLYDVEIFWLNDKWVLLEGLNDKWDEALQEAKLFRSFWRDCSSSDDLMCLKHLVSSAKSRALLQWIVSGRSFMYKMNRRGPRMFLNQNHSHLLHKLSIYNISGKLWFWFKNYLTDRFQFVSINNECSFPPSTCNIWSTPG